MALAESPLKGNLREQAAPHALRRCQTSNA